MSHGECVCCEEHDDNVKRVEAVRLLIDGLGAEVVAARRNLEMRGKGGQQVPFHGDFAAAPPSTLGRLDWWVRALREALNA